LQNDINGDIVNVGGWYRTGTLFKGTSEVLQQIALINGDVITGLAAISLRAGSMVTFLSVPANLTFNQLTLKRYLDNFFDDLLKSHRLEFSDDVRKVNLSTELSELTELVSQLDNVGIERLIPVLNEIYLNFSGIYLDQSHPNEVLLVETLGELKSQIADLDSRDLRTLSSPLSKKNSAKEYQEIVERLHAVEQLLAVIEEDSNKYIPFPAPGYSVLELDGDLQKGKTVSGTLRFTSNLSIDPRDLLIESGSDLHISNIEWGYNHKDQLYASFDLKAVDIGLGHVGITHTKGDFPFEFHFVDIESDDNNAISTQSFTFRLQPNPATDFLLLTEISTKSSLEIFDLSGRGSKVGCQNRDGSNCTVDIRHLQPGLYFIKDTSSIGQDIQPFIKMN